MNLTLIDPGPPNTLGPHETLSFNVVRMDNLFEFGIPDKLESEPVTPRPQSKEERIKDWQNFSAVSDGRPTHRAPPSTMSNWTKKSSNDRDKGSSWGYALGRIYLNVDEQRIDPPLPPYDRETMKRITKINNERPLCYHYHLNADCDGSCGKYHGKSLDDDEALVLKHWARRLKCRAKYRCREGDCIFAHHCPVGGKCKTNKCVFGNAHGPDLNVMKVL